MKKKKKKKVQLFLPLRYFSPFFILVVFCFPPSFFLPPQTVAAQVDNTNRCEVAIQLTPLCFVCLAFFAVLQASKWELCPRHCLCQTVGVTQWTWALGILWRFFIKLILSCGSQEGTANAQYWHKYKVHGEAWCVSKMHGCKGHPGNREKEENYLKITWGIIMIKFIFTPTLTKRQKLAFKLKTNPSSFLSNPFKHFMYTN